MTETSNITANFNHFAGRSSATVSGGRTKDTPTTKAERESFWRHVDNAYRRFTDQEPYSGILAESQNLNDVRKAFIIYCYQKDFRRPDRVKRVSTILKRPVLNFCTDNIDGRAVFSELGGFFRALKSQSFSSAHLEQIKALANPATVEVTVRKHCCSHFGALVLLYHEVARLNDQFGKVKRWNAIKTHSLTKIVEHYELSHTAEG